MSLGAARSATQARVTQVWQRLARRNDTWTQRPYSMSYLPGAWTILAFGPFPRYFCPGRSTPTTGPPVMASTEPKPEDTKPAEQPKPAEQKTAEQKTAATALGEDDEFEDFPVDGARFSR